MVSLLLGLKISRFRVNGTTAELALSFLQPPDILLPQIKHVAPFWVLYGNARKEDLSRNKDRRFLPLFWLNLYYNDVFSLSLSPIIIASNTLRPSNPSSLVELYLWPLAMAVRATFSNGCSYCKYIFMSNFHTRDYRTHISLTRLTLM